MSLAEQLLDAHVRYVRDQLTGDRFVELAAAEIDFALSRAHELTLDDVVRRDAVKAVAVKYVGSFALPGAIPEFAGAVAALLRRHPATQTRVGELLPRRYVSAAVDKLAELPATRAWLTAQLATSPAVVSRLADYLYGLAIAPVTANRRLAGRIPGASAALERGAQLAGPALRGVDLRGRELTERAAARLLVRWQGRADDVSDAEVAEVLMGLWDDVADRRLVDVLAELDDDDLADLLAAGYEVWLQLRTQGPVLALVEAGVDHFFDTYGGYPLDTLLDEFGLGRDDLLQEAARFAPAALDAARRAGLLDALIRRQLAGFYASPEVRSLLEAGGAAGP